MDNKLSCTKCEADVLVNLICNNDINNCDKMEKDISIV